jgi:hypothetical protein
MFGFLFNRGESRVFELYYPGFDEPSDEYRHTFGGEACHEGVVPPEGKKPVHLFYQFDLKDRRVGLRFPTPGLTRFPLYYALGNLGGPFYYRVVSDSRIEILSQPYPKEFRAEAMRRYPKPFRPQVIDLGEHNYDPTNPRHVFEYAGVLGIDTLTSEQKAELRVNMDRWFAANLPHRSLLEGYVVEPGDDYEDPPLEELVSQYCPFTQGMPKAVCPNPACEWYGTGKELPVLAYLEPEKRDPFYKRIAGGDSGQLIWSVCPNCASVEVENPCT